MRLIKNFKQLATSETRRVALKILEAGLEAIQPEVILKKSITVQDGILTIKNKKTNLTKYDRVFLIGFGKGAAGMADKMEKKLGKALTKGWVIDTVIRGGSKIKYTLGTHPLPSKINLEFTEMVLKETQNLTKKDLVILIICGGGSALFEAPYQLGLKELSQISTDLINSGANIEEINIVRKHLSKVKGGGLAKYLYPAKVLNMIFSDVPGNDLSVIASGPTVRDNTTMNQAIRVLEKYSISRTALPLRALTELPKEDIYFDKVENILVLSNMTALEAMKKEAKKLGYKSFIFSDRIQGEAKKLGKKLIEQTPPGTILLAGGETTIKVTGKGKGGRNQALVLAALPIVDDTLILAFDSDGLDYYHFGGALADKETWKKCQEEKMDQQEYLKNDDSFGFFKKTGDGILSDKLGSNVTDLILVLKI